MAEREHMTQDLTINDVQKDFRPLMNRVSKQETRVLVEEDGRPAAALVSPDDLDQLRRLDAYRRDPWSVIDEIHARNRDRDSDEVERDVADAIAEVRAENRARQEGGASK